MVNTLSGSISAYRKETVKPRFIRIDEVMVLFNVTRDEAGYSISCWSKVSACKDYIST